jgi:hypothetical protein
MSFGKGPLVVLAIIFGLGVGLFLKALRPEVEPDRQPGAPTSPSVRGGGARESRPLAAGTLSSQLSLEARNQLESLEELAAKDPAAALVKLATLSELDVRSYALAAIARGWAKTDPQAAADWIAQLKPEDDALSAALGLIPVWGASKPDACLSWATGLEVGNLREVAMTQLADAWVARDPQAAVTRYFELTPEPGSERGLHVIVSQWALDAPTAAVNYFKNAKDLPRREEFLETAVVSLTNLDPALAWSYSSLFTDPKQNTHVRSMALEAMAEANPLDAIRLAESVGNDPVLLQGVARGWSSQDADAAKAWIQGLADPVLVKLLMEEISQP